jgi:N-acetylglucosamine-6-phosphate deacetylase
VADRLCLVNGEVLTPEGWITGDVLIENGVLLSVGSPSHVEGATRLEVGECRVVPGLIDMQVNGGWGLDLQDDPSVLWDLGRYLATVGVTTFLPTLTTNGHDGLTVGQRVLAAGPPGGWRGAQPLGWHLEGPWIAEARAGAHDRAGISAPVEGLGGISLADVRLVTLAPELSGASELIESLTSAGVVVSMGHSEASIVEVYEAKRRGASMGTHLFNAMSGLDHREPGLAAGLLLDDALWVGLIADGHHVAPQMIDLAWKLASERIILVSDAVAPLGTTDAEVARLADGTIAGSTTTLLECVRNVQSFAAVGLAAAIRVATDTPARCLGLDDRGRLVPGRRADLLVLDPDGEVVLTLVQGEVVFDRG